MTHQEQKIFRINWLMSRIAACDKAGLTASKKKIISEMVIQFGAGERYVKEIFTTLENAEKIVIKGDEVYSKVGWEAEQILNNSQCQTKTISKEEEKSIASAKS